MTLPSSFFLSFFFNDTTHIWGLSLLSNNLSSAALCIINSNWYEHGEGRASRRASRGCPCGMYPRRSEVSVLRCKGVKDGEEVTGVLKFPRAVIDLLSVLLSCKGPSCLTLDWLCHSFINLFIHFSIWTSHIGDPHALNMGYIGTEWT